MASRLTDLVIGAARVRALQREATMDGIEIPPALDVLLAQIAEVGDAYAELLVEMHPECADLPWGQA